MKLSDMFDANLLHISDKIVVQHISVNGTLSKLDLEPKYQDQKKFSNMTMSKADIVVHVVSKMDIRFL